MVEKTGYWTSPPKPKPDVGLVKITGLDVPFLDLVWFLVKVGLASLPALVIVSTAIATITPFLAGVIRGL